MFKVSWDMLGWCPRLCRNNALPFGKHSGGKNVADMTHTCTCVVCPNRGKRSVTRPRLPKHLSQRDLEFLVTCDESELFSHICNVFITCSYMESI